MNITRKDINFPPEKDDRKKCEKNNVTIALNVLHGKKKKKILLVIQNITQTMKTSSFF